VPFLTASYGNPEPAFFAGSLFYDGQGRLSRLRAFNQFLETLSSTNEFLKEPPGSRIEASL
jgi:hypothetical protein